jgi:hypothetical protein
MFSVYEIRTGRRIWTPGFGYMGAGERQERGVQLLNGIVRTALLGRVEVAKVYLHPQGRRDAPALRRVLRDVARMVNEGGWRPATYAELCDGR